MASQSLNAVLSHPAIWRGGDCAPEPATLPTGHAALDAVLPGGGWPQGALTEILLAREGIGELRLALPALARLTHEGRAVVWVAPPHRPYAPALAAAGIDLARFIVVRCRESREALWAYEQALRAADCGAAFAWLDLTDARMLRRLQVAAREGRTFGVLWRRPGQRSVAAPVPLRLALEPRDGRLAVHVVKRRGAPLAQPVMIDVARAPGTPWIAAEIPEEKRHERPRTSLRHDGVQQRVGEPPPAGGLRQAVAG
ncbi:MAG TPA: translesion DNA synthesis-associated protein ImuA [Casimicrobiaceae bacterium]|nr:translesion DNA synthesis-associated protein ImuA [Casimicrobiaceae bacterium]